MKAMKVSKPTLHVDDYLIAQAVNHNAELLESALNRIEKLEKGGKKEDAISRQAAQAKIKNICDEYGLSYEDGERKTATGGSAYALGHAFDDLPPVTPTRKKGRWITVGRNKAMCSECEITHLIAQYPHGAINYCPNCGAEMG